jgi:hypothetical protein
LSYHLSVRFSDFATVGLSDLLSPQLLTDFFKSTKSCGEISYFLAFKSTFLIYQEYSTFHPKSQYFYGFVK